MDDHCSSIGQYSLRWMGLLGSCFLFHGRATMAPELMNVGADFLAHQIGNIFEGSNVW